jgi:AGZA family xanthine/uracil permease-like MFS transporter
VLISGELFLILSLIKLRERIVDSIPSSLKMAISAGIGLFLGIDRPAQCRHRHRLARNARHAGRREGAVGDLAVCGFLAIVALDAKRIPGAIIISVLAVTAVGIAIGITPFGGIASPPPSLAPTFLKLDLKGALDAGLIAIVFAFFFVDRFDNTETLVGVAPSHRPDREGRRDPTPQPRARPASAPAAGPASSGWSSRSSSS